MLKGDGVQGTLIQIEKRSIRVKALGSCVWMCVFSTNMADYKRNMKALAESSILLNIPRLNALLSKKIQPLSISMADERSTNLYAIYSIQLQARRPLPRSVRPLLN